MSDITNKLRLAFILTFSYEIYLSRARNFCNKTWSQNIWNMLRQDAKQNYMLNILEEVVFLLIDNW